MEGRMFMCNKLERDIKIAYKKLKANIYFDKTQLPLRNKIVDFELNDFEKNIKEMNDALLGNDKVWNKYQEKILKSIDVLLLPKKLSKEDLPEVIFNTNENDIVIDKPQFFIDLDVTGHILGVLWILFIGRFLDDDMYEYSYGNRLRRTLVNNELMNEENNITFSPSLFQPYFSQYEDWRDKGLKLAKNCLIEKQDALILTLDFKSFFYNIEITSEEFDAFYDGNEEWKRRVNLFVFKVIKQYSKLVNKITDMYVVDGAEASILPIGFLPSNILSNWRLNQFDRQIIDRWNPVYYGRYVDDIIIVDKVEKNSSLLKEQLSKTDIIKYYFCGCNATKSRDKICPNDNELFICKDEKNVYSVNRKFLNNTKSHISVQNDKVKVFYFKQGATEALLTCFQTQIAHNVSEFRFLPDIESGLIGNDYSEIFDLNNSGSINKLRDVNEITLNKFELSKFLGKYLRVGAVIEDKKESKFDKDLLNIFDKRMLIENYASWEKLFEILVVNNRVKDIKNLVKKISEAIGNVKLKDENIKLNEYRKGLYTILYSSLSRALALCWGTHIKELLTDLELNKIINYKAKEITCLRKSYCLTRMVNKYTTPLPVDCIKEEAFCDSRNDNFYLYKLDSMMKNIKESNFWGILSETNILNNYIYYPYIVAPQEISFSLICKKIAKNNNIDKHDELLKKTNDLYFYLNYLHPKDLDRPIMTNEIEVKKIEKKKNEREDIFGIFVNSTKRSKLRAAIGNAILKESDVISALCNKPNRTYDRYKEVSKLLSDAIKEGAELLVLPENYLPFEWLPILTRFCARNQMSIITGIEHVVSLNNNNINRGVVYNLTAVILPYRQEEYKYAHVTYHQKVHFSPNELRLIKGYNYRPMEGNVYCLFKWGDIWFSLYCCFELSSIKARSLFQSYADLCIVVEWNRDINYYSSIMESFCRDLHCYCIQVNSSDYGDSRIVQPSKTEILNIIRTKGGKNRSILVEDIDIDVMRNFQIKEYELQKDDSIFKPTPPQFDKEILKMKMERTLKDYLWK